MPEWNCSTKYQCSWFADCYSFVNFLTNDYTFNKSLINYSVTPPMTLPKLK